MLLRKKDVNKVIRMYAAGGVIGSMGDPGRSSMDPTQYFQPTQGAVQSQPAFVSADYFKPYSIAKPDYSIDKDAFAKIKGHSNEIEATTSRMQQIESKLSKMDAIDLNSAEAKSYISELKQLSSPGYLAQLENARNITDKAFESTKANHAEGTMVSKDGRVLVDDGASYKMIPWAEYAAHKDKYRPVTGAQLYEQRYKDSRLSFKDNVSALLGHNVGLDKVTDEINKSMSHLGSTSSGGDSKRIAAVQGYIGYVTSGGKSSQNYEQVQIAQEAIWDTLPSNMRETLKGEAASRISVTDEKGKKKSTEQLHSDIEKAAKDMVTNLVLRAKTSSSESTYKEDIDAYADKDKKEGKESLFFNDFRSGNAEVDMDTFSMKSAITGENVSMKSAMIPINEQEKFKNLLPQSKDGKTTYTSLFDLGQVPIISGGKDISHDLQNRQNFKITGGAKRLVKMPENEQASAASAARLSGYEQQLSTTTDPNLKAHLQKIIQLERLAYGDRDYLEVTVTADSNDFQSNKDAFSYRNADGKYVPAVDQSAYSLFTDTIDGNNAFGIVEANDKDIADNIAGKSYSFQAYIPFDNGQYNDGQIAKNYQDVSAAKQALQQAKDLLIAYKARVPKTAK